MRSLGRIAEQETGNLMSRATFTEVNYAHYTAEVPHGDDGDTRLAQVPKLWLADSRRVEVDNLDYMPGEDRLAVARSGVRSLNLWRGMGCEPEPGDVDQWLELLAANIGDEEIRHWLISWLAWPLQNLGQKMNSLVLLFGPSGVGKGLFLKPFRDIYGDNAITISNDALKSNFNSLYARKQFIHVDELPRLRGMDNDGGVVMQKIKLLTTDDKLNVNTKGQPEYEVRNCANMVLTANYHDVLKLDEDDRRACVIKWEPQSSVVEHRGDQPYWMRYVHWMENGGSAALYQYLLGWDCTGFDPAAWAPMTQWKVDVTEASMEPMELWAKDLKKDPDGILPLLGQGRALWTAKELGVLYWGCSEAEITHGRSKVVSNALKNAGFVLAAGGIPLRPQGREGVQARFYVVRAGDKPARWQDSAECVRHLKMYFK